MRFAVLVALASLSGCLANHYVIPQDDLVALAQTEPQSRGQSVRVIQGFVGGDAPPAAPEVRVGAAVVVAPGPGVGPAPTRRQRPGGGNYGRLAKAKSDDGKAAVILAAVAALTLAVTEGARYDGWAELHPMHPVHIYTRDGQYFWVPLAQLDPETAMFTEKAFVRDTEGPWRGLGRAPLNRRGLTYSVFLGGSEFVSADGSTNTGFGSHIQFGVFPAQELGLQLDIGLGWTNNDLGARIYDSRWAAELDLMPLALGRLHGGVFGQGGWARRFEDGPTGADQSSPFFGGGALVQLELTTRLAISARAGTSHLYGEWVADAGIGLSIY